jgi:hypothetical protein
VSYLEGWLHLQFYLSWICWRCWNRVYHLDGQLLWQPKNLLYCAWIPDQ